MILKTMDGAKFTLNPDQVKGVMEAITRQDTFLHLQGAIIRTSAISGIYPEGSLRKTDEGVLHDGSRVVKKFGRWVDADNPAVRIDPSYYPEIAKDCVSTPEEYDTIYAKITTKEDRLTAILSPKIHKQLTE